MKMDIEEFMKWALIIGLSSYLLGCSHTIQGMKQDIHESTAPTEQKTYRQVIVKPAPAPAPQVLPTSPPPLQTPSS